MVTSWWQGSGGSPPARWPRRGPFPTPAILCDYDDERAAALGLLENIQREDLNPFEQAQGLRDVIALWDCTQAEAAKRLGMAQPTLANKLRLLQLTTDQRQFVLDNGLTERHARALLRLEDPEQRLAAVEHIGKNQLNVADAEGYIDRLVTQNQTTPIRRRSTYILKDVRLFLNSVDRGVRLMQTAGVGDKGSRHLPHRHHSPRKAAERCVVTLL